MSTKAHISLLNPPCSCFKQSLQFLVNHFLLSKHTSCSPQVWTAAPVWYVLRLLHQSGDDVPKLQQRLVDILGFGERQSSGTGLSDALATGQVTKGELAHRPHPRCGVSGSDIDDKEAVAATAAGIDVVTAHSSMLEAFLHNLKDLLW